MAWIERFRDRLDAGRRLAAQLSRFARVPDVLVLALPRGGVPVAAEVAKALGQPLDLLLVRKLGIPGNEETAMGAIAANGVQVLNDNLIARLQLPPSEIDAVVARETKELARREALYRGDRPPFEVTGKTVIVVDDGIATGATMQAAIRLLRRQAAGRIVVATPVAPPDAVERLAREADEMVAVSQPETFEAVGQWYKDFGQTSDAEVRQCLVGAATDSSRNLRQEL